MTESPKDRSVRRLANTTTLMIWAVVAACVAFPFVAALVYLLY